MSKVSRYERAYVLLAQVAQRHAATCGDCYVPIIDAEGNPGFRSEACPTGAKILRMYERAEARAFEEMRERGVA